MFPFSHFNKIVSQFEIIRKNFKNPDLNRLKQWDTNKLRNHGYIFRFRI